jgi:hypothetical protein
MKIDPDTTLMAADSSVAVNQTTFDPLARFDSSAANQGVTQKKDGGYDENGQLSLPPRTQLKAPTRVGQE